MKRKISDVLKKYLLLLLLVLAAGTLFASPSFAEEYEEEAQEDEGEEGEFIPETYYDPVQSNDIPGWPQGPAIQAAAGIVMDMDTDTILYAKNINDRHFPASITKIMTTLVALENADINSVINCGEEVFDIEADSTHLGIQPGEQIPFIQALYGLMLESANDLGNAIAVHVAGSVDDFAELMNEKARQLGCENTHFANPHGLHDEDHYTCAKDMALIAQAAYMNETFRMITSTVESSIEPTNMTEEVRSFVNHQRLLRSSSDYYQSWCTGGKTGFTQAAWNTLVTYGERDGKRLVCVLLRENGAERACIETISLMDYAFENFENKSASQQIPTKTFAQMLGIDYPGAGAGVYQDPALSMPIGKTVDTGFVTVPAGADTSVLGRENGGDGTGQFRYTWNGWPVGYGAYELSPIPERVPLVFEQPRDMETLMKLSEERRVKREIERRAQAAADAIRTTSVTLYDKARKYVENNRMTVVLAGALILAVLVILIIIVVLRCTRDSRIRRHRQQEERELMRSEEAIEAKSAVEIEEELRAAMQEEAARRERAIRRLEAQRREEEQLRETERIIEQIRNEHND